MDFIDNFNYRITGNPDAPKLVFLHGLMGFSNNWRSIAREFEKQFHILVYDQRGHGRSFRPDTGYGPEDYAEDLKKILDSLASDKVNLVGHSMGSRNANHFAYKYPNRVESLVLEDLGPEANPESYENNAKLFARVPTPFSDKKQARAHIENEFADDMVLGEYLYANLEQKKDGQIDWRFYKQGIRESVKLGRNKDRWQEFESLAMPTLLIRGELSDEFPAEIYKSMLTRKPEVKGVEIPAARHWVHFDQKELFIAALKEFFEENSIGLK